LELEASLEIGKDGERATRRGDERARDGLVRHRVQYDTGKLFRNRWTVGRAIAECGDHLCEHDGGGHNE
jgi:hypothetical protein